MRHENLLDPLIAIPVTQKRRRSGVTSRRARFNRILVPIDFSRPSLKAIPYALAISRQFDADSATAHWKCSRTRRVLRTLPCTRDSCSPKRGQLN
jgi:hypothetical protein